MTEEGKENYRRELEEKEIHKIWDNAQDIQETYVKWCKEVEEIKSKHEEIRKISSKRRSKTMRLLMQEKKKIKERLRAGAKEEDMVRLNELKEQMLDERHEAYYRKLKKNCEEIRKNGKFNSAGFWKVKKRMERRRDEGQHAVRNKKGELVTTNEEILKAYEEHYEDLLTKTNKRAKMDENEDVVKEVNKKFDRIMKTAYEQEPITITEEMMEEIVNGLKKKKARDNEGWNNEMLIDGGKEMVVSLTKMVNEVIKKYEIPIPWLHMTIKSIHKNGEKVDLDNKRGLFLTNVISKVFESAVDGIGTVCFDRHQNGGQKRRGGVDNWMLVRALIDEGRRLKQPVYFFFADLVKCFDRLWLRDCLNDLHDCGMREREIGLLYKLNEKAHFKVDTPAGKTEEIIVEEIVKQGTIFGPKLCCGSTGKVNEGLEEQEVIFPTVIIKALAYVDDIIGGGGREFVKAVMEKCKKEEKEKLWEFSVKKSKWMCITRKKKVEDIDVEVTQGKLEKTSNYKCLGNMINDKGNIDDQLKYMESKVAGIIREGRSLCCSSRVGKSEIEAKTLVNDTLAVPAIYYNIETWTNLRQNDILKLRSIQGKVVRGLIGLPKSTPVWGMLYELGILPIMKIIIYKKLMLYHNLLNSDDERLGKILVEAQEESGFEECWFGETKREAMEIGIELRKEEVLGKRKSAWKKDVKGRILECVKMEMKEKIKESKKMRFLVRRGCDTYLKELFNENARLAIKIRLNMVEWIAGNMGEESLCPLCEKECDTTEHVFACEKLENKVVTVKDLENGEKMMEVVNLFKRNEERRRTLLSDELRIKFDILRLEGTL